ncbi:MAG: type I restriction-modification system subunit M N-terminal domain-containing protein [Candidatus Sulfotelmatobacter sp.]
MNNFGDKVSFIWSVADLLRDSFKRAKYPDVILPLTVLRRLDCVLEPTKAKVLETHAKLKGKLENLAPQLCKASGFAFYNTSQFTFERLLQDHAHLAANLRAYMNGFSENMREVLEKFDFGNTISKLDGNRNGDAARGTEKGTQLESKTSCVLVSSPGASKVARRRFRRYITLPPLLAVY